jgi:hypothetical protein
MGQEKADRTPPTIPAQRMLLWTRQILIQSILLPPIPEVQAFKYLLAHKRIR